MTGRTLPVHDGSKNHPAKNEGKVNPAGLFLPAGGGQSGRRRRKLALCNQASVAPQSPEGKAAGAGKNDENHNEGVSPVVIAQGVHAIRHPRRNEVHDANADRRGERPLDNLKPDGKGRLGAAHAREDRRDRPALQRAAAVLRRGMPIDLDRTARLAIEGHGPDALSFDQEAALCARWAATMEAA